MDSVRPCWPSSFGDSPRKPEMTSSWHRTYRSGRQAAWDAGRDVEAWELFTQAAKLDSEQPSYALRGAVAADRIGNLDSAGRLAQQAWDGGLRDLELLRVLAEASRSQNPPTVSPGEFLLMLDQLPAEEASTPAAMQFRADQWKRDGQPRKAIAIWTQLLAEQPDPTLVEQIALAYVQAGQLHSARQFLEDPAQQPLRSSAAFSLLVNLQAGSQEWQLAEDTCEQAQRGAVRTIGPTGSRNTARRHRP